MDGPTDRPMEDRLMEDRPMEDRPTVNNISRFVGCLECISRNDQSKINFFPKLYKNSLSWLVAPWSSDSALKKSILFQFLPVPLEMATLGDSKPITCVTSEHCDM